MIAIDHLEGLLGSAARAGTIAALFGDDASPRHLSEIARDSGLPLASVRRELVRLVQAGIVCRGKGSGLTLERTERKESYARPYWADRGSPLYAELRTMAMKTRGVAAAIRSALPEFARLSWITGAYAVGLAHRKDPVDVVVIGHPKQLISRTLERLSTPVGRQIRPTVIYQDEWVARLDKRELTVRRLRRRPKLWLRGDAFALMRMERGERETKELVKQVVASGEDLTDDWDDDWDPDDPFPRLRGISE